jgi:hypothetical protein
VTHAAKLFSVLQALLMLACLAVPNTASAASILFGRVGSSSYVIDGGQLVQFLIDGGNTVDYVDLSAGVISDFSGYSQVWVYDLVTGPDNSPTQTANYANIANWYNGLADKNLIVDGRIISSGPNWVAGGEPEWIQNYAAQLDAAGGGLLLGTDHFEFHDGINSINALIGINPFTGFFGGPQAVVDPLSPLFIASLLPCAGNPAEQCINDNSTTGFVPTGLQPNGQFLTPVAYHGTVAGAFDNAAVAGTFASETFPSDVPEPSTLILLGTGVIAAGVRRYRRRS